MLLEVAKGKEYRKYRESYWIKGLPCHYPFGLNYLLYTIGKCVPNCCRHPVCLSVCLSH